MENIGKILMTIGIVFVVIGFLAQYNFFGLGKLPGDIIIKRENLTFYFPLATSILISIILTVIFLLFRK